MNKKISVIIPVYNVEQYLNRCVESVVNQTYKNLEIILVDDGSPDNCPKMCDEWAKKDSRIKVIHKENGGLSSARNAGLDVATGDYISFLDSDDYFDYNALETAYNYMISEKADVVGFELKKLYEPYKLEALGRDDGSVEVFTKDQLLKLFFSRSEASLVIVCTKLYKKDVIKDLRFKEGKLHEDEFILLEWINKTNKFVLINKCLYFYFQRTNSITGNKALKNYEDILESFIMRKEFIDNKFHNFKRENILNFLFELRSLYMSTYKDYKTYRNKICKIFDEHYKLLKPKDYKNFLFKHFKWLYILLWKIKNRKS